MNKRSIRAFAFGILITVCILGSFYYFSEDGKKEQINIEKAEALLNESGFIVVEKQKYSEMENTITKLTKKEAEKPQKKEVVNKPKDMEPTTSFTIEIVSGMVSHDISSILEEKKLIDDADRFETYLEEYGYSKKIQLGTFEVKKGMSYKEIANIITKS
ncbi:MltG/YceG/YrrL family protein [Cytobacillus dafuensis]|uniref:Endolytic transglycosylase MltG n=1 Tax=Cytobacillus dafuensis TaxID=1742359 RepID=A0A5B8Z6F1_CYTDA|nr:endolytic transglycosylase MltG [Cytobacillus dafuensis]QED48640.1 endolytic transglycosylase MltG [Cytobacillus dafuensis]